MKGNRRIGIATALGWLAIAILLTDVGSGAIPAEHRRKPQVDDFLRLNEIGVVRPSPDGSVVAVEVRRGRLGAVPDSSGDRLEFRAFRSMDR